MRNRAKTLNRRKRMGSLLVASAALTIAMSIAAPARAQSRTVPPERSAAWNDATTILALSALGLELVMPRVFYADPEVTAGWKARWHISVFAPIMTLATLTLVNEHHLKSSFASPLPGCDDTNPYDYRCQGYGMFSSQSFLAFSALGQGTGVFLGDTLKWSDGRFNAGAFTGEVGIPLVLAVITAVGRTSGDLETGGQVWASAGVGAVIGLGTGLAYSLMQRPECGYSGSLLCW
ncbi:MAG TPA: hypothetical protein VK540_19560 [Polyangiaceae bacterium]|nr:hypothetical protein [Polyangiaceae bacterium]